MACVAATKTKRWKESGSDDNADDNIGDNNEDEAEDYDDADGTGSTKVRAQEKMSMPKIGTKFAIISCTKQKNPLGQERFLRFSSGPLASLRVDVAIKYQVIPTFHMRVTGDDSCNAM